MHSDCSVFLSDFPAGGCIPEGGICVTPQVNFSKHSLDLVAVSHIIFIDVCQLQKGSDSNSEEASGSSKNTDEER